MQLLSSETDLPDPVEDDLVGCETLDFERSHGIGYGESFTLVPSVNAYDLPLLTVEQLEKLVSVKTRSGDFASLVADSARRVEQFDDDGAAKVAEYAQWLADILETSQGAESS